MEKHNFALPVVVAGAAIFDERKRLFLMRSSGKFANQWIIPGGKPEFGERLATAVRREVREETALNLMDVKLLGLREWIEPNKHFICVEFSGTASSTEVVSLNNEAVAWGWFTRIELAALDIAPLTKELINERLIPERLIA